MAIQVEIKRLNIREAAPEDAKSIYRVLQHSFKKYCDASGLAYCVDALQESDRDIIKDMETKKVFVAVYDEEVIGTMRFELKADQTAYLTRFGVLPEHHGIGVGQDLMRSADEFLRAHHVTQVSLHTALKNKNLVRFYHNRGFTIVSTSMERGYPRAFMVKYY